MSLSLILRYSMSALGVGCAVAMAVLVACRVRGRRPVPRTLLLALYLGALIQITALRLGLVTPRWLGGALRLKPLETTLSEARRGAWPLIYHVLGNLGWFVPLGLLLPGKKAPRWLWRLLAGLALSAMIEAIQYLLGTGVSDVDDVLLNGLGALAGYGIFCLFAQEKC